VTLATANAAAVGLAVVAWWATSGMDAATSQLRWSGIGLFGALIALAANAWFLARGRQLIRGSQGTLLAQVRFAPVPAESGPPVTNGVGKAVRPVSSDDCYVSVAGSVRYHRPTCPMVARKDVDEAPRSVQERSGRRACEVCEP